MYKTERNGSRLTSILDREENRDTLTAFGLAFLDGQVEIVDSRLSELERRSDLSRKSASRGWFAQKETYEWERQYLDRLRESARERPFIEVARNRLGELKDHDSHDPLQQFQNDRSLFWREEVERETLLQLIKDWNILVFSMIETGGRRGKISTNR